MKLEGTTIIGVRKDGQTVIAGDGQVTQNQQVVMKSNARKVRRVYNDSVILGFAGSVADAFTLSERFEEMLNKYSGNLMRAAVELAMLWRGDRNLRQLEALMIVADKKDMFIVSGSGDVIEPEHGVCAIGSGGNYALAAGRARKHGHDGGAGRSRRNEDSVRHLHIHQLQYRCGGRIMDLTPKQIVAELDRYIIGQNKAKRAVAIALRNRYRRSMLAESVREEITPKNIIMKGPTGVGKTEIARRLAKIVHAPFIKVEATKYTEVGYVGRDVESMIRDLAETAVHLVKEEQMAVVESKAREFAENKIIDAVVKARKKSSADIAESVLRAKVADDLRDGKLNKTVVEIEVAERAPQLEAMPGMNIEFNLNDMLGGILPQRKKRRRVSVEEALAIYMEEESERLLDMDAIKAEGVRRAQEDGIIFIDEIDKIAHRQNSGGGMDVSREGVQRDILPIVEGCTVMTKYGAIKTDYILFIAAGAFQISSVTDLIPELQGRFPIRVDLESLTFDDFVKIFTEPENAVTRQYAAMLSVENIKLTFTPDAIEEMSRIAVVENETGEDIGARRLHTIMESLLEDISFNADGNNPEIDVVVDKAYVEEHLAKEISAHNLKKYIL